MRQFRSMRTLVHRSIRGQKEHTLGMQALHLDKKAHFDDEGISFAFSTQTL